MLVVMSVARDNVVTARIYSPIKSYLINFLVTHRVCTIVGAARDCKEYIYETCLRKVIVSNLILYMWINVETKSL